MTGFKGLKVSEIEALRRNLRQEECRYQIVKNSLTRLACRRIGMEFLEQFLEGPTAIACSSADPIAAARVFLKFNNEHGDFSIRGGLLEGKPLDLAQIKVLGEIPSKEILLGRVCGAFQAPLSGLAGVLQGSLRKLVFALEEVRRLKESA